MKNLLSVLIIFTTPSVLFSHDSILHVSQKHALRIEYNLVVPHYDSLINYYLLPYKKVLTIHEEEALLQNFSAAYQTDFKVYYDLKFNFYYRGFERYNGSSRLSKNKWIKRGRTMAVSKQAAHDVLGVPCKAIQVKNNLERAKDTLLVYATNKYGLNFFELGEIDGLALEYEIEYENIGKVKYRAVKIDSILLLDGKLADISSFKVEEKGFKYKREQRLERRFQRYLERIERKMIGAKAPLFRIWDMDENLVKSKKLKGKIMVLHFWSGFPPSSLIEFSYLNKVVEKYKNAGDVTFISFANRSKYGVKIATAQFPLKYTQCYEGYYAAEKYRCPFFPVHVVVDQEGNIVEYFYGVYPDIAKRLIAAVEKLRDSSK